MATKRFSGSGVIVLAATTTVALAALSSSAGQGGKTGAKQPAVPAAVKNYRAWKCVTPSGGWQVSPPPDLTDCIQMTPQTYRREQRRINGPHTNSFIRVYVNQAGEKAFSGAAKPDYPIGTAIIKEKYRTAAAKVPELMTVMVKRQPGYDSKNGDWEYLVLSGDGRKVLPGTVQHCRDCHQKARENGYVFRPYAPPASPR